MSQLALDTGVEITRSRVVLVNSDTGEVGSARWEARAGCYECALRRAWGFHPLVYCITRAGEGGFCYCPDHINPALRALGLPELP